MDGIFHLAVIGSTNRNEWLSSRQVQLGSWNLPTLSSLPHHGSAQLGQGHTEVDDLWYSLRDIDLWHVRTGQPVCIWRWWRRLRPFIAVVLEQFRHAWVIKGKGFASGTDAVLSRVFPLGEDEILKGIFNIGRYILSICNCVPSPRLLIGSLVQTRDVHFRG